MRAFVALIAACSWLVSGSVAQAQLVSSLIGPPVPADTVPPSETVAGAPGAQLTYRRGDAVQPRITRAANCTLDATGSCSITWTTALSANPTIVTTPINPPASQAIMCNTTATPTTTAVAIKCWTIQTTLLSLAIVTTGLTLAPAATAPAGTVVQVIAIPPTQ